MDFSDYYSNNKHQTAFRGFFCLLRYALGHTHLCNKAYKEEEKLCSQICTPIR